MMKKALLPVAAAVLAASCNDFHTTWLEVGVGAGYAGDIFEMEWPAGSGEHVTVNQSLADSAGFAGIEIEIRVPGEPLRTLTAIDFRGRLNNTVDRIDVNETARKLPGRGSLAGAGQAQHQRMGRDDRTMRTCLVTVLTAAPAAAPVSAQPTSRRTSARPSCR